MYEYLNGKLAEKAATRAVIDIQGVGYEVRIPVSTFSKLPALGENVKLWIHFVVREDAQQLYGFSSQEERGMFRLLVSVSGIGPKMGVTLLSGVTILELKQAIIQGAVQVLTSVPGIGKKTAERVIIELREKIVLDGSEKSGVSANDLIQNDAAFNDSLQALLELGYARQNARTALQKALQDFKLGGAPSVSELVRKSLKYV